MATRLVARSPSRFIQVSSAFIIGRRRIHHMIKDSHEEKIRKRELRRTVLPSDPGVKPFSDIPGPPSLPLLGTLWKYYRGEYKLDRPQETYSMFQEKYGPLVKENLYCGNCIVHIFDPQDLKEAYRAEIGLDAKRESHGALRKYRLSRKDFYGHPGVSCSNGKEWNEYRYETFKEAGFPQGYGSPFIPWMWEQAIESIADDFVRYMKSNLDHNREISLLPALNYYTLECMGAVMFGRRLGCFDLDRGNYFDGLIEAVQESHCAILRTDLFPPILVRKDYKNLEIAQDFITDFVFKGIQNITDLMALGSISNTDPFNESEKKDFVIDEDKNSPVKISNSFVYTRLRSGIPPNLIFPMAADFFEGGIQTPAHTLAFMLYNLARNPDKQQILRKKLEVKKEGKDYLSNVILESLRLNPATIGTGRTLYLDLVLSGYHVPKGTHIIYHHDVATKLESNYSEPLRFIPERSGIDLLDNFVFRPFINGSKRTCLGKYIAIKEFEEVLKKIISQFEISYHHQKVGVRNFLINEPDAPIKLRLKEL